MGELKLIHFSKRVHDRHPNQKINWDIHKSFTLHFTLSSSVCFLLKKNEIRHNVNFVIIGDTTGCHNDNLSATNDANIVISSLLHRKLTFSADRDENHGSQKDNISVSMKLAS